MKEESIIRYKLKAELEFTTEISQNLVEMKKIIEEKKPSLKQPILFEELVSQSITHRKDPPSTLSQLGLPDSGYPVQFVYLSDDRLYTVDY